MEVRRYLENDITAAMDKIRTELGRDAYILSTRNVRRKGLSGFFSKPMVEVVAAYEPAPIARPKPPSRGQPSNTQPASDGLSQEDIQRIDSFFSAAARGASMGSSVFRPREPEPPAPYNPALAAYGGSAVKPAVNRPEPKLPVPENDGFRPMDENHNPFKPAKSEPLSSSQADELKRLSEQVESLTQAIAGLTARSSFGKGGLRPGLRPEIASLMIPLQENEVHEEFISKIADELAAVTERQSAEPAEVLEQLLRQHLGDPAPLRLRRFKRTVVMLVGPTGVGKTTTLAKLAAIYTLNHHAKVGIITTDTYRMAAIDQLKTYAEIMNLPLSVVYSPEEMPDALRAHDDKDLVFIDTAGRSPNDPAMAPEIADYVRRSDADEVLLCVAAGTGFSSCLSLIQVYGFLKDYRLLVTKLDETPVWGSLLNLRFLSQRPISYTALGQNVPDDIEAFNPRKVAEHLMGRGGTA